MNMRVAVAIVLFASTIPTRPHGQPAGERVPLGVWGGSGMQLTVTPTGATIDYGCDSGTIAEPLGADGTGRIDARGTHTFGRGGPREPGERAPKAHAARYEGTLRDRTVRLKVTLPELGRAIGDFTLELDRRAVLERCG